MKKETLQLKPIINHSKFADVDLNEMALFTQVVETGGFTPAAKKSGVPLSTVSRKMTSLEERLGVRLIQRSTRHIHLTELGEQYYVYCRKMLDAAMEAEELVQNASSEPSGTLKMATPFSMDSKFTSTLLEGYLSRYQKMNVEIHRYNDHLSIIDEGFDCAIMFGKIPDSNYVARSLGHDRLILCASPVYLKKSGEPKNIESLKEHIGLLFKTFPFVYDSGKEKIEFPLRARYVSNDPLGVKRFAIDDVGICYLPAGGIKEELDNGSLVQVLPEVESRMEISLLYPGKKNFSPKLDTLIEYMLSEFEKGVPWEYGR